MSRRPAIILPAGLPQGLAERLLRVAGEGLEPDECWPLLDVHETFPAETPDGRRYYVSGSKVLEVQVHGRARACAVVRRRGCDFALWTLCANPRHILPPRGLP